MIDLHRGDEVELLLEAPIYRDGGRYWHDIDEVGPAGFTVLGGSRMYLWEDDGKTWRLVSRLEFKTGINATPAATDTSEAKAAKERAR